MNKLYIKIRGNCEETENNKTGYIIEMEEKCRRNMNQAIKFVGRVGKDILGAAKQYIFRNERGILLP